MSTKETEFSNASLHAPVDLNARRRAALAEIDNAKFGWYHVRVRLKVFLSVKTPLLTNCSPSGLRHRRSRLLYRCLRHLCHQL